MELFFFFCRYRSFLDKDQSSSTDRAEKKQEVSICPPPPEPPPQHASAGGCIPPPCQFASSVTSEKNSSNFQGGWIRALYINMQRYMF